MEVPKLVYCAWLDIHNSIDPVWVSIPDETEPSKCFTVGWLVQSNDDCVKISATYSFDDNDNIEALLLTVIPRGCITKLQELSFPILETPVVES